MTQPATDPIEPAAAAQSGTRTIALVILALVVTLIILHLIGDRLTPYSDEARVHAFVVPITPEVAGIIEQVHVRDNQRVKRGQPLFTLGGEQYGIAIDKARADVDAVLREQKAQDAAIIVAEANLAIAETEQLKAAQDATRTARIYREDPGAISLRRVEFSTATYAEARSRIVAARAQIAQARAARGAAGADNDRLVAARSAFRRAELDRRRTSVTAPADGIITDLTVEAGRSASPGSPVMTLISVKDAWISANLTENNLGRMKVGDWAEIVLDVRPGEVLQGKVRSIGFGIAAGGKASPGALPEVQNSRDFLRPAQRFPVIIEVEPGSVPNISNLREGGQAEVIVYTGDNPVLNALGRLYIRAMGILSYAY